MNSRVAPTEAYYYGAYDLLGPVGGQEPIKFIALICVSEFAGKRGAVCGKRLTFLRNSPMNKSNINIFTIIFVIRAYKG